MVENGYLSFMCCICEMCDHDRVFKGKLHSGERPAVPHSDGSQTILGCSMKQQMLGVTNTFTCS